MPISAVQQSDFTSQFNLQDYIPNREVPVVAQRKRIQLVSMRMWVQSLASIRGWGTWRCCELWCRSQMWLRSLWGCGCGVGQQLQFQFGPSLHTSMCWGGGPKKPKKKKKKKSPVDLEWNSYWSPVQLKFFQEMAFRSAFCHTSVQSGRTGQILQLPSFSMRWLLLTLAPFLTVACTSLTSQIWTQIRSGWT